MGKVEAVVAIVALIVVGVVARLVPHMPNFAPVTATALFCGAYMSKRYSVAAPLAVMLVSDYALLYVNPYGTTSFDRVYAPWSLWHSALPYVYGSFAVSAFAGWYVARHRSPGVVLAAALFCSVQFFLITNAGVWLAGAYARGLDGLLTSYEMALPFFRGTLLGDLFYTAAFFGGYEAVRGAAGRLRGRVRATA